MPDVECVLGMLQGAGFKYFSAPRYMIDGRLLLIVSKKGTSILNLKAV